MTNLPYPSIRQIPLESGGRPVFELLEDFEFTMQLSPALVLEFRKRAGFLTDFGSVPFFLWPIVHPQAMHLSVSFFIHDDCYHVESKCPRLWGDLAQRMVASRYGASWPEQLRVYNALRSFGWLCYPSKGIVDRRPKVIEEIVAIRSGPNEE